MLWIYLTILLLLLLLIFKILLLRFLTILLSVILALIPFFASANIVVLVVNNSFFIFLFCIYTFCMVFKVYIHMHRQTISVFHQSLQFSIILCNHNGISPLVIAAKQRQHQQHQHQQQQPTTVNSIKSGQHRETGQLPTIPPSFR